MSLQEVLVTAPGTAVASPRWITGYEVRLVPGSDLGMVRRMPSLVVVRGERPGRLLADRVFLSVLQRKLRGPGRWTVVLELDASTRDLVEQTAQVIRAIGGNVDVELAYGPEGGRSAMVEVQVKRLAREGFQTTDAVAQAREVIRATSDLRATSGRVSAAAVAGALGLSAAELASLLGTTRQRVSKTPDAKALQTQLAPFERVCRLRAVIPQDDFAAWLRLANPHLDGSTPLECVQNGEVDAVADLVEDMLTGQPS